MWKIFLMVLLVSVVISRADEWDDEENHLSSDEVEAQLTGQTLEQVRAKWRAIENPSSDDSIPKEELDRISAIRASL
ncbi:unnamed protein product [Allacma fusca]|uniref:Uncharacterized protein n=1 Tax=Allacma fusca TaxID=39272 RepID=A0A8J2J475_9HEXA|nr:unnamed protein product [Allacma fusca]